MKHRLAESFEAAYLKHFWKFQRCQWENYADDAQHALSVIDKEMFELVTSYRDTFELSGRRGEVFKAIMARELVERHPDVSRLRNRLDLDKQSRYYGGEFSERDLARRIKPDVLELMRTRNHLSQKLGFPSYVALVLSTEEVELESLIALLEQHLQDHLSTARTLVRTHQITLTTSWLSGLDTIGCLDSDFSPIGSIEQFWQRIGFAHLKGTIPLISQEQPTVSGYVGVLSVPDDVRILVRSVDTLGRWLTLFHELGHATAHALNEENGIFTTWTSVYDETMAEVLESIASFMLLDEPNQQSARELKILTGTRCAISGLFEFALWENPSDAERLYVEHFNRLGLEVQDPEVWALDTFRYLDPIYIFNYVIGHQVADRTLKFLNKEYGDEFSKWGDWLKHNYYADGRRRSLREKTAIVGSVV
ncbi:MAG: hypothetical protein KAY32_08230 [Candidatus Eisenbacteria sp.]|nr:hypothetical protein [Candidatus Eisenbacteria bacterium]